MLKRTITAIVSTILLLPVLWYSDTYVFAVAMSLVSFIGNFEMLRCLGLDKRYFLSIPQYIITLSLPFLVRWGNENPFGLKISLYICLIYMLYLFCIAIFSHGKLKLEQIACSFMTCLYINIGFNALILLRDYKEQGVYIFLLAFIGAWITDIFAYFCGMAFGKHKLIPDVSPKKTVEGSVGGMVFCSLAYVIYGFVVSDVFDVSLNITALAVFGLVISLVAQVGDLTASFIKREYGIKDYGNLFPGHGGVLDRFDSVLPVSSVLAVLVYSYTII